MVLSEFFSIMTYFIQITFHLLICFCALNFCCGIVCWNEYDGYEEMAYGAYIHRCQKDDNGDYFYYTAACALPNRKRFVVGKTVYNEDGQWQCINRNGTVHRVVNYKCSGCDVYTCMADRVPQCSNHSDGYLRGFAKSNCAQFKTKEIFNNFRNDTKHFANCTASCLIEEMDRYLEDHTADRINCTELDSAGFHSLSVCYLRCGFCDLWQNVTAPLLTGYRLSNFYAKALEQVKETVEKCKAFKEAEQILLISGDQKGENATNV